MDARMTNEELAEVAFRLNVNRPIHWQLAAKLYREVIAWRRSAGQLPPESSDEPIDTRERAV